MIINIIHSLSLPLSLSFPVFTSSSNMHLLFLIFIDLPLIEPGTKA